MSEKQAWKMNGFVGVLIILLLVGLSIYAFFTSLSLAGSIVLAVLITIIVGVLASGFTIV
ncbi:MAG: SPFH domain-containing protein, partial [Syntrophomonadaceae bacterium]|nr:SPFH domain-containing protein [Syntrophomonadaceae bacterium]